MDEMSVNQFAGELKMPANVLLEQLQKAGVAKSGVDDLLTEQDKARLLDYLRRSHGDSQPKGKITLTRKQTSEIRATDSSGRARTVQVEVRKKRVFVKRDELLPEAPPAAARPEAPPAEPAAPPVEDVVPADTPVVEVQTPPPAPAPEPVMEAEAAPAAPEAPAEPPAAEPVEAAKPAAPEDRKS